MERSTFVCIAQVSRHQQTVCGSHSVRFVSLSVYCFVEGGGTFHVGKPDLIFETFFKVKFPWRQQQPGSSKLIRLISLKEICSDALQKLSPLTHTIRLRPLKLFTVIHTTIAVWPLRFLNGEMESESRKTICVKWTSSLIFIKWSLYLCALF